MADAALIEQISDLYGWPWCVTFTFQSFSILSRNSVPAGQNISKFLLNVAYAMAIL